MQQPPGRIVGIREECSGALRVEIIVQRFAERRFLNENLVERSIAYGTQPKPGTWTTIVGVVGNVTDAVVYRVMSCLVAQRTHEFGVRMALGAGRGAILRLVLRDGLRQGLKGALLGISCAVGASQPLGQYVIGMSPLHVATCAGAAALVLAVALAASFVAARRAARVDPLAALRHE